MKNCSTLFCVPKEHLIRRELKRALFGERLFCPHCGSLQIKKYNKRYRCKLCRKPFSLTSVSWLRGTKLSLASIWQLLGCWTEKIPIDQARKFCGISEVTTRRWYEKFRGHLPQDKLDSIRLSGVVQMDEAYRGGKKNGYAILGAKEEAKVGKPRRMVLQVLPKSSVDRKDVVEFISQVILPTSRFNTDGAAIYRGIGNHWPLIHRYDIHKKFEFALTSEIEGTWGNLFTFIRRMYHHVTRDKISGVIQEFVARSMFKNWFYSPENYIAIAFARLPRPKQKEWRGRYQTKKKVGKIFSFKNAVSPFILQPEVLLPVPSCLVYPS